MHEFESATHRATDAINSLNSAKANTKAELQKELNFLKKNNATVSGRYDDRIIEIQNQLKDLDGYGKGGVDTTGGPKMLHGNFQSPEVIFNAVDAKKLYDLVHNAPDPTSIISRQINERIEAINSSFQMSLTTPPAFMGDITVHQGDVIVKGGMDKSVLKDVKQLFRDNADELTEIVLGNVMKKQHLRGHGNMKY